MSPARATLFRSWAVTNPATGCSNRHLRHISCGSLPWPAFSALILPLALVALQAPFGSGAVALTAQDINEAEPGNGSNSRAIIAKVQILLGRANFPPGVIDGRMGENVGTALRAFREANDIAENNEDIIDSETWDALVKDAPDEVITERTIEEADIEGPFTKEIPDSLDEQRDLERLGYRDASEQLAETYHMDQDFFESLNKDRNNEAGSRILVANVRQDDTIPGIAKLEVVKSINQLRAYDEDGKLLAAFPATVGSQQRPAPSGELTIEAVAEDPTYTVKPSNNLTGVDASEAFDIAPGPNNPVGTIWIELSKDSYGIHGSPEPAEIGKTSSHGCVRLTNWDAETLARSVEANLPVHFVEEPGSSSN
jgi:lipoprotein-anchoring transpeptidase ErfK/SrfK